MSNVITGIDGNTPVYNTNQLFHIWALVEIFMGAGNPGANKYVPNVGDRVIDQSTNDWYSVDAIDQSTFVPTLTPIKTVIENVLSPNDVLMGVGPGTQSDTYRVYIDKSVVPYTLCVDARLKVAGSASNSAVLYVGSLLDGTAKVVSGIYDQSGNLLGQNIPLEIVASDNISNISIKTVAVCHTNENLQDGEIITAVIYSADGNVMSKRQLLVENTAFIRSTDTSVKYISEITLESPFLSKTDNKLIQFPLNVPLNALMLTGVVTYSDGSQIRMPVDGNKFSIFGFDGYVSSIVGQKFNVVLKYSLSANEVVYGANNINGVNGSQFITTTYKATTLNVSGEYDVKLFAFPVWIDVLHGYSLQWYLYTLDRGAMYNVTPYVGFNANSVPFNPTAYGVKQTLSIYIDMQNVDGTFTTYRNIQTIDITLMSQGTNRTTNWTIGFSPNQNPAFGINNKAIATTVVSNTGGINTSNVDITCGNATLTDWLNDLYINTLPLTDPVSEITPPTPNQFSLIINGQDMVFPINSWNTLLSLPIELMDTSTLFIKFMLVLPNNTLNLSIAAIPVYAN